MNIGIRARAAPACIASVWEPVRRGPSGSAFLRPSASDRIPLYWPTNSPLAASLFAILTLVPQTPVWVERWVKPVLPGAIRIEMAPLAPVQGRLQPVTLTIPVHVTRFPLPPEPYENTDIN